MHVHVQASTNNNADTHIFDIVSAVLQGDTLAPFLSREFTSGPGDRGSVLGRVLPKTQ